MPSERWRIGKRQKRIKEIKEAHKDDPDGTVATLVVMVEELADSFEDFRKDQKERLDDICERQAKDDVRQAKTEGAIIDLTTSFDQHAGTPKAHEKGNGDRRSGAIGKTGMTLKELILVTVTLVGVALAAVEGKTGVISTAAAGGGG